MCSIFDILYMERLGDTVQAFSVDRYGQPRGLELVVHYDSEALSSELIRYGPYRCRCSLRGYESWQEAIQHVNMILCERCGIADFTRDDSSNLCWDCDHIRKRQA